MRCGASADDTSAVAVKPRARLRPAVVQPPPPSSSSVRLMSWVEPSLVGPTRPGLRQRASELLVLLVLLLVLVGILC